MDRTRDRRFEETLVEQCAPTLAGLKPASLFRFAAGSVDAVRAAAGEWNAALSGKGLRVTVLKDCPASGACVIYVYRPEWVARLVERDATRSFLARLGYLPGGLDDLLDQLSQRLCMERDFPHEVGVFLGYPLRDVIGFIENRGWNYTCCGCWKSYGDPEAARACFERYRRCTRAYCRRFACGTPLAQLALSG